MSEVTRILNQMEDGSIDSADALLPLVYRELRNMAAAKLANEKAQSIAATGLVHEAYLRLVGNQSFDSRRHFFGAAAQAMRRILIDRARARKAEKRGGDAVRVELSPDLFGESDESDDRLEELDEALQKFESIEPEKAELVKLRYFAGMKIHEAAEVLGISTATADRHWAFAKAWMQSEMAED